MKMGKMHLMIPGFLALFSVTVFSQSGGSIVTEVVNYRAAGVELQGYLAYDDAVKGKRPSIIVVHEWWGLNPYARMRTGQLAKLGYIAFAIDIYGKGVRAKDPAEAGTLSGIYRGNRPLMRSRANAGLEVLRNHPLADVEVILFLVET